MKKIVTMFMALAVMAFVAIPALAAKPETKENGAKFYNWHLSGSVMPVPPYGSADIEGSDTSSKLIVNQPNGKVTTNLTGVMKGLTPDTTYTVYLSKGYTPYTPRTIEGTWKWIVAGIYEHEITITKMEPDGSFVGTGKYPSTGVTQTTEIITGQVSGNNVTLKTVYKGLYNPGYTATAVGIINGDGSMSGTVPWIWTTSADAVKPTSGSTGFPGLITGVSAFTFTTDSLGEGSWHYNFKDTAHENLSVWINGGGKTILISDSIEL